MQKNNNINKFARYSGIAFEMLGIIFLGVWGGTKIDEKRQAEFPTFTLILSLFSVFSAIYIVIKGLLKK